MPFAEGDLAVVAAAGNADRAALLLSGAKAIGEGVVGGDVINLRGGLVVPGTPGLATVHCDDCALVAGDQDDLGIDGIDPDVLVIVATGRAAKAGPGLAAVDGLPGDGRGHVNDVGVLRIQHRNRQVAAADATTGTRIGGD